MKAFQDISGPGNTDAGVTLTLVGHDTGAGAVMSAKGAALNGQNADHTSPNYAPADYTREFIVAG